MGARGWKEELVLGKPNSASGFKFSIFFFIADSNKKKLAFFFL